MMEVPLEKTLVAPTRFLPKIIDRQGSTRASAIFELMRKYETAKTSRGG